jgi:N-acetylneuraminate synthase
MKIVAEIGINHNGDLAIAKKLIDVAYTAGCDFVKFQKRTVEDVYTEEELNKPRESPWGETTREQKFGLEFEAKEYNQIHDYCMNKVGWFASPWDIRSIHFLLHYRPSYLKIPSALITNKEFLEECRSVNVPLIMSTGMSDLHMIDEAIDVLGKESIEYILHCTSTYPTDPGEINAACLGWLKLRYPWAKIGFSNHYPGLKAMEIAMTFEAEMIEFHLTLDRAMVGSDQASSIEPQGLFKLMESKKLIERMLGDGIKTIYESEVPIAQKLRRYN